VNGFSIILYLSYTLLQKEHVAWAETLCPEMLCPEMLCPETLCPETLCPEMF
jgi:hypothetical protein